MTVAKQYFAVEPILKAHLAQAMPDLNAIYTPFNIEDMLQITNVSPSVSIIYYDDRIGDNAGHGRITSMYQQWLLTLCVNNAQAQLQQTQAIRGQADPFIIQLLDAMQGFDPHIQGYRPFKRTNSPVRVGSRSGFVFFPFLFETQILI